MQSRFLFGLMRGHLNTLVRSGFSFHFRNLHHYHLLILCSISNSQLNSHFSADSFLSLHPPEMITAANPFPLRIFPDEQTRRSLPTLLQLFIQPFNHHLSKVNTIKMNTGLALPPAGPEKGLFCTFWYFQDLLQPLTPPL